ncbi:MAG: hypothetical protein AAGE59_13255 [Cyanobacteria bacterium P01_F01_bin.86]
MQTEFEFCLPTGYVDERDIVHQIGIMRRSRAMDEILPMQDPRVQANPAYATVIILARVIVRLGDITEVTPQVIENMFASDLSYLQTLYRQINSPEMPPNPDLAANSDSLEPTETPTEVLVSV